MVDSVPPISTQVSALAAAAPDAPAVTCEGRTLTRAELDASTNRLARAYAELGVGTGDYVSIAPPKLIEAGGDSRIPAAIGLPLGMADGGVNLLSVGLNHNTGFMTAAAGLLMGHHLVVMPRFEPEAFLRLIGEHGVTFLATVPTVMQRACYPSTGPTPPPTICHRCAGSVGTSPRPARR